MINVTNAVMSSECPRRADVTLYGNGIFSSESVRDGSQLDVTVTLVGAIIWDGKFVFNVLFCPLQVARLCVKVTSNDCDDRSMQTLK